jgi:hypothetical protein
MVRLPRGHTDSWATGSSRTMNGPPGSRGAAATHSAAAIVRPGEAPSAEAVEDGAGAEVPLTTPPRDQGQRRRAEKTTRRPPAGPLGIEDDG